jgi:hypothetical protein
MSLNVKSYIGKLRTATAPDDVIARVVQVLVAECRSFYFEPGPDGRSAIFVDEEHMPRINHLIREVLA